LGRLFSSSAQQHQQTSSSVGCIQSLDEQKEQNQQQQVFTTVLKLNMLQDNPGAVKKKRRIGRGIGSSKGKTSGRGHKGQKARSGGSIPLYFEGGQTRFFKLLPKRGFTNKRHKVDMLSLNVGTIQDYIDMGRFPTIPIPTSTDNTNDSENNDNPPTAVVLTMKDFMDAGLCTTSSNKHGMKLLAKGKERVRTPIKIEISRASESAIAAIEAVGGEVTTVHYNKLALRTLLKPHKYNNESSSSSSSGGGESKGKGKIQLQLPKNARPNPKWQPYYTNWNNRGYLSVQAQMRKLLFERPELETKFTNALTTLNNNNDDKGKEGDVEGK